jgi:hypothetical protein
MADAVFKNVQVLKGIPVDQFLGTMGLFAAALSYDCSGCHTGAGTEDPKWEDDTPRKLTARRMIAMVQTINKDNFSGRQQVTLTTPSREPATARHADARPDTANPSSIRRTSSRARHQVSRRRTRFSTSTSGAGARTPGCVQDYAAKGTSIPFGTGRAIRPRSRAGAQQLVTPVHAREGDMARSFDGTTGYFCCAYRGRRPRGRAASRARNSTPRWRSRAASKAI